MSNAAANERFGVLLNMVLGQALAAAGYESTSSQLQEAGGKFTYWKRFGPETPILKGLYAYIEFQHLPNAPSEWAPEAASRFTIFLTRSDEEQAHLLSEDPDYARRMLSELIVEDFSVAVLPAARYWWSYQNEAELAQALAAAGRLLVGYGLPWLADEITPPAAAPG